MGRGRQQLGDTDGARGWRGWGLRWAAAAPAAPSPNPRSPNPPRPVPTGIFCLRGSAPGCRDVAGLGVGFAMFFPALQGKKPTQRSQPVGFATPIPTLGSPPAPMGADPPCARRRGRGTCPRTSPSPHLFAKPHCGGTLGVPVPSGSRDLGGFSSRGRRRANPSRPSDGDAGSISPPERDKKQENHPKSTKDLQASGSQLTTTPKIISPIAAIPSLAYQHPPGKFPPQIWGIGAHAAPKSLTLMGSSLRAGFWGPCPQTGAESLLRSPQAGVWPRAGPGGFYRVPGGGGAPPARGTRPALPTSAPRTSEGAGGRAG